MGIVDMQRQRKALIQLSRLVIGHLHSFFSYYAVSRRIEIESPFNLSESMDRLLALNKPRANIMARLLGPSGEKVVHVDISKRCRSLKNPFRKETRDLAAGAWLRNQITVCYAHQRSRSNILQLFTGAFEETDGKTVLRGKIGMELGARVILGAFCFMLFIFFPASHLWDVILNGASSSFSSMPIVWLCFWGMLETFYWYGKNDAVHIVGNLHRALTADELPSDSEIET